MEVKAHIVVVIIIIGERESCNTCDDGVRHGGDGERVGGGREKQKGEVSALLIDASRTSRKVGRHNHLLLGLAVFTRTYLALTVRSTIGASVFFLFPLSRHQTIVLHSITMNSCNQSNPLRSHDQTFRSSAVLSAGTNHARITFQFFVVQKQLLPC